MRTVSALGGASDSDGFITLDSDTVLLGQYSRAGMDLAITAPDGSTTLVQDYFLTDEPPILQTPGGQLMLPKTVKALAGPLAPGQYAQASAAAAGEAIGEIKKLDGEASVQRTDGTVEDLVLGAPIFQGDVIQTADGAKLSILFIDGTALTMSANARMIMDELVYNPDATDNSMVMNLVQGTFVFVTGQVAKTGSVEAHTPVATMGIRGTTPMVAIGAAGDGVQFALGPDPITDPNADPQFGQYDLRSLIDGQVLGTVSSPNAIYTLTSATGTLQQSGFDPAAANQFSTLLADTHQTFTTSTTNNDDDDDEEDGGSDGEGEQGGEGEAGEGESGGEGDPGPGNNGENTGPPSGPPAPPPGGPATGPVTVDPIGTGTGGDPLGGPTPGGPPPAPPPGPSGSNEPPPAPTGPIIGFAFNLAGITMDEDTPATLSGFSISYPSELAVEIQAGSTVTLASLNGITFDLGDGTGDSHMIIRGSASAIQNALNGARYDPTPNATAGTLQITFRDGASDSQVGAIDVPITIASVEDPPFAADLVFNLNPGIFSLTSAFLGSFDGDGDPVTYTIADHGGSNVEVNGALFSIGVSPRGAAVVDDGTELAQAEVRSYTFTFEINDGDQTDTGNITVNFTGVNDAPTANNVSGSTDEDSNVTISPSASDPDNNATLTYAVTAQPAKGSVTLVGGNTFRFDPGSDFQDLGDGDNATATFTYSVTDEHGASDTAQGTVTVNGVNDAPTANAVTGSTNEDSTVSISPDAADVDNGATLTYAITAQPAKGSVTVGANNQLVFDPGNDFQNLDDGDSATTTFTYSVTDEHGASDTAQGTVTVGGVNDTPVANDITGSTDEDSTVTISPNAVDVDDDATLTYAITAQPAKGSVTLVEGSTFRFDPGSDFQDLGDEDSAQVTFTYSATDEHGAAATATGTVTVNGNNDSPTIALPQGPFAVNEDNPITISGIQVADAEDDTLTVTLSVGANGTVGFTPNSDLSGITPIDNDGSDGTIKFSGTAAGIGSALAINQALATSIDVTPANNFNGTLPLTVTVSDGNSEIGTQSTLDITVNPVNDAPTITLPSSPTTDEDETVTVSGIQVADVDGDNLSVTLSVDNNATLSFTQGLPIAGLSFTDDDGTDGDLAFSGSASAINAALAASIDVTPVANSSDNLTLTVGADDSNSGTDSQTLAITVNPVSDAPSGADKTVTIDEDGSHTFTAADFGFSDPIDNPADAFTGIVVKTLPGNGSLKKDGAPVQAGDVVAIADINAGKLVFTPDANDNGTGYAAFTFQVRDDGQVQEGQAGTNYNVFPDGWTGTGASVGTAIHNPNAPTQFTIPNTTVVGLADNAHGASTLQTVAAGQPNAVAEAGATYTLDLNTYYRTGHGDVYEARAQVFAGDTEIANVVQTAANRATIGNEGSLTLTTSAVPAGKAGEPLKVVISIPSGLLLVDNVHLSKVGGDGSNLLANGDFGSGSFYTGENTDPTPNTITVDVTAVNDAPVANDDVIGIADSVDLTGFSFNPANGHYYKYVSTPGGSGDAVNGAAALGAYVATITSQAENDFVYGLLGGGAAFLGGSDGTTEGQWTWINGPEAGTTFWNGGSNGAAVAGQFVNWRAGEPSNTNDEDALAIGTHPGSFWNDVQGGYQAGYVAEVDPKTIFSLAGPTTILAANLAAAEADVLSNDTDVEGDNLSILSGSLPAASALGASVSYNANGDLIYDPTGVAGLIALGAGEFREDSITYRATDGTDNSNQAMVKFIVEGVNNAPQIAQRGTPEFGSELTVNQNHAGWQYDTQVIKLADGRVLFTFQSNNATLGDVDGGAAYRIGTVQSDGSIQFTNEGLVNDNTDGTQGRPQAAQLADGRIVFTYETNTSLDDATDPSSGVAGRIGTLQSDGSIAFGPEFTVAQHTDSYQATPQVIDLGGGKVLFGFSTRDTTAGDPSPYGISGRIGEVQADGSVTFADEFVVNQHTGASQLNPEMVKLADGRVLFVFDTDDATAGDTHGKGIGARLITPQSDGSVTYGSEFRVNDDHYHHQEHPQVDLLADGRFVFTYVTQDSAADGDSYAVMGRVGTLGANGVMSFGPEFVVNEHTSDIQNNPRVVGLSDGRVLFIFETRDSTSGDTQPSSFYSKSIAARIGKVEADGSVTFDGEFRVNEHIDASQYLPQVVELPDGRVLVNFMTGTNQDSDTSASGVAARVFELPELVAKGIVTEIATGATGEGTANHVVTKVVDFTDPDLAAGHTVTVTAQSEGYLGTLTANVTNDASDGAGQITWTFTVNDATLNPLAAGQVSDQIYDIVVNDNAGGTDTSTLAVRLVGANDPPTMALPATSTTNEDTPVNITGFTVADVDGDDLTVTVNASSTVSLAQTTGLTFTTGDGTDDATMTFKGSVAAINAALNTGQGITYKPTADFNGTGANAGSIAFDINDGNGGSVQQTLSVNVNAVNDAPVIDRSPVFRDELRVNEHTVNQQAAPQMTQLADGRVLFTFMTFDSTDGDTSSYGVSARIGTVAGDGSIAFTDEFRVNEHISGNQQYPQVTQLADGRVLFTFESQDSTDGDNSGYSVAARIGTVQGNGSMVFTDEFRVNEHVSSNQQEPQATQLADGRVLFTFKTSDQTDGDTSGTGVSARVGTVQGDGSVQFADEFRVVEHFSGGQTQPQVTQLADGRVLFTFTTFDSTDGDTSSHGVSARIGTVQANGSIAFTDEFRVNEHTWSSQHEAQVTQLADGRVLFTFTTSDPTDGDNQGSSIAARVGTVQANGSIAFTDEVRVNEHIGNWQADPQVTALADGRVLFTFDTDDGTDGDDSRDGLAARIGTVQANGSIVFTDEFRVNEHTTDDQQTPQVIQLADDRVLFTFKTNDATDGDNNGTSVAARVLDLRTGELIGSITEIAAGATGENTATHSATAVLDFLDVDLTTGHTLTVTPQAGGYYGALTASISNDAGDGAGQITWTFTVADSALAPLSGGQVANQLYDIEVKDAQGATDTATVKIELNGANDAPTIALPAAQTTNEDTAVTIKGFTVADAESDDLTVTVNASSTVTLAQTTGLSFTTGDGTDDATMTFTGTVAAINAALNTGQGITYKPTDNFSGTGANAGSIAFNIADPSGASVQKTLAVNVNAVNDAPVITSNGGSATASINVSENQTAVTDIEVNDPDDGEGSGLTYSLTPAPPSTTTFDFNSDTPGQAPDLGANLSVDALASGGTISGTPGSALTFAAAAGTTFAVESFQLKLGGSFADFDVKFTGVDANNNAVGPLNFNTGYNFLTFVAFAGVGLKDVQLKSLTLTPDDGGAIVTVDNLTITQPSSGPVPGADNALFNIDPTTGVLTFKNAPDFDNPGDAGGNNVYDVQVKVTDSGGLTDLQDIAVTVNDVITVTPDDFANGTLLTSAFPHITLKAVSTDDNTVIGSVVARASNFSSTGSTVFGHDKSTVGSNVWGDGTSHNPQLRIEFSQVVKSVSIDVIADDSNDSGRLEIYDASGNLLDSDSANVSTNGQQLATLTATSTSTPIAYAIVNTNGNCCAQFDNLQYTVISGNDPIVLDLDGDGFDLSSTIAFDLNADGDAEQTAWAGPRDGVLVLDHDGSGAIEDGAEVFSPWFGDGGHADALAALASLDTNDDGIIDTSDLAFGQIGVWVDADGDGVSHAGELGSLIDHGIASIDLDAQVANSLIDGQQILAEGQFTLTSGDSRSYVAVAFANQGTGETSDIMVGSAGNDLFVLDSFDAVDFLDGFNPDEDTIDITGLLAVAFDANNPGQLIQAIGEFAEGALVGAAMFVDADGQGDQADFQQVASLSFDQPVASAVLDVVFNSSGDSADVAVETPVAV